MIHQIFNTMKRLAFVLSFAVFILSSCAYTNRYPFTSNMMRDHNIDDKNIKRVQFYLSAEINLIKINEGHAEGKEGGVLIKNTGGISEKIRIAAQTPCIVEKIDKAGVFHVRVEEGSNKTLKFAPRDNGRYYLVTEFTNNRHQVEYGKEMYYVPNPSLISFLMVVMKKHGEHPDRKSVV